MAVFIGKLVVDDDLGSALDAAVETGGCRLAAYLRDAYVANRMTTDKRINAVGIGTDGTLSYLPANRFSDHYAAYGAQGVLALSGRQQASIGKVLRKMLVPEAFGTGVVVPWRRDPARCLEPKPVVADADVEHLAVFLQARLKPLDPFLVVGEAIRYWYWEGSYTETEHSSLHESCMRYATCWNGTRFYAQNPRVVGLLVALAPDGKLLARALVWNGKNGPFMDRVYGSDRSRAAFRAFAAKRGWDYRRSDRTGDVATARDAGWFGFPVQHLDPHQKPPFFDTFDPLWFHESGDRAAIVDHYGRTVGHADSREAWLTNPATNPVSYAALGFKGDDIPFDHPLRKTNQRGRDAAEVRHRRVDWLSDLADVPPWPAELVRSDPVWTLGPGGADRSDPEDDAANLAVVPPRRTEAREVARPTAPDAYLNPYGDLADLGQTVAAIRDAFDERRRRRLDDEALRVARVFPPPAFAFGAALQADDGVPHVFPPRNPPPPRNWQEELANAAARGRAERQMEPIRNEPWLRPPPADELVWHHVGGVDEPPGIQAENDE